MDQSSAFESCPLCREKGQIQKLIYVYYNRAEAFSTCENKNCVYFVTDRQGNPVKFRFNEHLKRLVPLSTPAKVENIDTELEELMRSLQAENNNGSLKVDASGSSPTVVNSSPIVRDDHHIIDSFNICNLDFDTILNDLGSC